MSDTKRVPVNTTNTPPELLLAEALVFGSSGSIERMESQGQRSFVESETLPVKMNAKDKEVLEMAGVKFLGPVEGDEVFQYVELPTGWAKKPTDHSMWSDLVDAKGRKRAGIFYKAAFYDRSANLSANRRYSVGRDYGREDHRTALVYQVKDAETVIFSTEVVQYPEPSDPRDRKAWVARQDTEDKLKAVAMAWIQERFPNWQDPSAYWD